MRNANLDQWLNANEAERRALASRWNVTTGEGKATALYVARLFKEECVYSVVDVNARLVDKQWLLIAHIDSADYTILKTRKNVTFLGFSIVFCEVPQTLPICS